MHAAAFGAGAALLYASPPEGESVLLISPCFTIGVNNGRNPQISTYVL